MGLASAPTAEPEPTRGDGHWADAEVRLAERTPQRAARDLSVARQAWSAEGGKVQLVVVVVVVSPLMRGPTSETSAPSCNNVVGLC